MKGKVDLNCDMGESFGAYKLGLDEEVIKHITSANVACGFHAGDPTVMRRTVNLARQHGVAVGAHPGFPDLLGFGRRDLAATPEEAKDYVVYQIGALQAFAGSARLQHVKPHGALYNMAARDAGLAKAMVDAVLEVDKNLILVALSGSEWVRIGEKAGLRVASEVFADRAYTPDGSLASRRLPGAVIEDHEQVVSRGVRMATEGKVTAINGKDIEVRADTICLHGDNPEAVTLTKTLKAKLLAVGVEVTPMSRLL
jgi:UPF0271 protein